MSITANPDGTYTIDGVTLATMPLEEINRQLPEGVELIYDGDGMRRRYWLNLRITRHMRRCASNRARRRRMNR